MSKVIHLSDDAHNKAKEFCREHALKMSDWVATLISLAAHGESLTATSSVGAASSVRAMVQKKKLAETTDVDAQVDEDGLPVYSAPPFWAQAQEH